MPRSDAQPSLAGPWTEEDAERYLLGLELFGMRFGLDRMRRLLTTLGSPQERFGSIHVVGTNGKSSTVRMIAAILERHGLRTGAYLSPHLVSFTERIRIDERDLEPAELAAAVRAAAHAAAKVDRTLEAGDRVTQFEALTAAALAAAARASRSASGCSPAPTTSVGGGWDGFSTASFSRAMSVTVGPSQRVCSSPTLVSTVTREASTLVAS